MESEKGDFDSTEGEDHRQRTRGISKSPVHGNDRAKRTKVGQGKRGDAEDLPSTSVSLVGKEQELW